MRALSETTVHLPGIVWTALPLLVLVLAFFFGVPRVLGRGGGYRRSRIRYGPSLPLIAVLAALRALDTLLLAVATTGLLLMVFLNARA